MRVKDINISNLTDLDEVLRFLNPFCDQVSSALQNGLSFQDNIRASIVPVSFSTNANQNLVVTHKLSATPVGYIAIRQSRACNIYDGSSLVLGNTFANLKCDTAGVTATILFF